jgi:hypothetical protein
MFMAKLERHRACAVVRASGGLPMTATTAAALAGLLIGSTFMLAQPAEARLPEPDAGSVIGGGLFGGVRLGPRSAAATQPELRPSELVGENCYLLKERVATPSGAVATSRVQVCE